MEENKQIDKFVIDLCKQGFKEQEIRLKLISTYRGTGEALKDIIKRLKQEGKITDEEMNQAKNRRKEKALARKKEENKEKAQLIYSTTKANENIIEQQNQQETIDNFVVELYKQALSDDEIRLELIKRYVGTGETFPQMLKRLKQEGKITEEIEKERQRKKNEELYEKIDRINRDYEKKRQERKEAERQERERKREEEKIKQMAKELEEKGTKKEEKKKELKPEREELRTIQLEQKKNEETPINKQAKVEKFICDRLTKEQREYVIEQYKKGIMQQDIAQRIVNNGKEIAPPTLSSLIQKMKVIGMILDEDEEQRKKAQAEQRKITAEYKRKIDEYKVMIRIDEMKKSDLIGLANIVKERQDNIRMWDVEFVIKAHIKLGQFDEAIEFARDVSQYFGEVKQKTIEEDIQKILIIQEQYKDMLYPEKYFDKLPQVDAR